MGFVLIYVTAVVVAMVLGRQERRHLLELRLEFEKLDRPMPERKPKLSLLTSWLNVIVGIVLLGFGALSLSTAFSMLHNPAMQAGNASVDLGSQFETAAVWLATAITLIILGLRSVRQHMLLRRRVAEPH